VCIPDHRDGKEFLMEKNLLQATYWLGLACVVVAVLWRALNAFAGISSDFAVSGKEITYWSFVRGAGLFLLLSIATAGYLWGRSQNR